MLARLIVHHQLTKLLERIVDCDVTKKQCNQSSHDVTSRVLHSFTRTLFQCSFPSIKRIMNPTIKLQKPIEKAAHWSLSLFRKVQSELSCGKISCPDKIKDLKSSQSQSSRSCFLPAPPPNGADTESLRRHSRGKPILS